MKTVEQKLLISGASFAGLCTAYRMNKLGYQVTIVELYSGLRKGGTPVNILGDTIEVVRQMGLLEQIQANAITMECMEFKDAHDVTLRRDLIQKNHQAKAEVEYEIERDVLLDMLYKLVRDDVRFIFGDSITGLAEVQGQVEVTFKNTGKQCFDLVFGCDGIHSTVRRLWFGPEAEFSHFLKAYASIVIVDKLLIPENHIHLYGEPGYSVMLNAYNGKTDIVLCFYAEQEIPYDYRDESRQRQIIDDHFRGLVWRTPELLQEIRESNTFYFDKLCQVRMPCWSKGRIALAGDAAYCASPAAGRGGSLAIDGAAALADAFEKSNGEYAAAFKAYDNSFRPFVEQLQADVVNYNLDMLIPKTEEDVRKRNLGGFGF